MLGMYLMVTFNSCTQSGTGDTGEAQKSAHISKPAIDTTKVLNTLELYRAKRYEGIQEALGAGADQVYKLVLYGRDMETLSPEIARLTYLASLDVSHNKLTVLPEALSELHYLQGFYATDNHLTSYPEQILLLPVLEKVDLSGNQIHTIPPEIQVMTQLTRLTLDRNHLTSIPVELYNLTKLSVLELSGNGLQSIPEGISNLKSITKLDLSGNQITRLPEEIATLGHTLEELSIQGNQIPDEEIQWLIEAMPGTQIRF
jgi:Leucine-rich repeat (LRR) protein